VALSAGTKAGKVRKDISPADAATLVVAAQMGIWESARATPPLQQYPALQYKISCNTKSAWVGRSSGSLPPKAISMWTSPSPRAKARVLERASFFATATMVFRTYFTTGRGGDEMLRTVRAFLDLTPLGRQEASRRFTWGLAADPAVSMVASSRPVRNKNLN
jgi:Bacterial protein of unknown function (DUF899)